VKAPDTTVVKGLQIKNATQFETEGFNNLLTIIQKYKTKNNTILNISGGYKAVIPYLTLFAQLEEIPLKYMYEDSGELITVGNLPFSLDWAVVEALKPFLNNYFLERVEIQALSHYWGEKKIEFSEKLKRFIPTNEGFAKDFKELQIKEAFHQLFNAMIHYQLIIWNHEIKNIQISALGKIILNFKFATESNKGYIMEQLLFKYFAIAPKNNITLGYTVNLQLPELPKTQLLDDGKKVEIGDIDVWLKYDDATKKYNVWGEIKAYSTAVGYARDTDDKYYKQLKARVLALNQPYVEILFIVFRFVFQDINKDSPFAIEPLKKVVGQLQTLETDAVLLNKVKFKCLGISIPANFKGNKIDLTESFYKGDFSKWNWEVISI
jgi:hypothetical protein